MKMGQGASTPLPDSEPTSTSRRLSRLIPEPRNRDDRESRDNRRLTETEEDDEMPPLRHDSRRVSNLAPYGTFRRQVSSQSVTVQQDTSHIPGNMERDEVVYEQEERPLVNMEDLGMRDGPITHIAAPVIRRPSYMSRLGSRLLPNSVVSGLLSSGEESSAEGMALRRGESRTSEASHGNRRSLRIGSLTARGNSSISRRQSIRGPFPYHGDATRLPESPTNPSFSDPILTVSDGRPDGTTFQGRRRSPRFERFRQSLALPVTSLFPHAQEQRSSQAASRTPPRRPSRVATTEDSDFLLPPLNLGNQNDDEHPQELDSTEHEIGRLSSSPTPSTAALRAAHGIRRLPNAMRQRSSRLLRRDEHLPLSRVLQLAAAAIAAQLSGVPGPQMPNVRAVGEDGVDGSLEEFVQQLQQAATIPDEGVSQDGGEGGSDGGLPPVNFLRVFRFVNNDEPAGSSSTTSRSGLGEQNDNDEEASDGRTVTLVVVGVRSVPSGNTGADDTGNALGPSLDTLLSLPVIPSTGVPRTAGTGSILRRSDGRSRFSSRRNSIGGINASAFPAGYDNQRHQRLSGLRNQAVTPTFSDSSLPTVLSESPPGPRPPPSTPAEPGRSGANTPNRRPSSASALPPPSLPHLQENAAMPIAPPEVAEDPNFNIARQRRRSDSEFARHRDLGSGAARRNGVVGPDSRSETPNTQGGRSWLIYVVGTNLSEDHPAFATPSLFTDVGPFIYDDFTLDGVAETFAHPFLQIYEAEQTATRQSPFLQADPSPFFERSSPPFLRADPTPFFPNAHEPTNLVPYFPQNPTYEDMLMLSSLLGPVKPPIATAAEVASSGGLFRITDIGGTLVAESLDNLENVPLIDGDRCVICLCDYTVSEEVRMLAKCQHMYHRECVDEWLTTGRNSCPQCREQGVGGGEGSASGSGSQTA